MKVYISNYRNHWYSPYTFLEKVVYRREIDYDDPVVEKWSNRLEPISKAINWFLDKIHPRVEYVKIDDHDVWNMDSTLAIIVLPMLKKLQKSKQGSPIVDFEDVPEFMRNTSTEEYDDQNVFDFYHEDEKLVGYDMHDRWQWVLNEMVFAFESYSYDWEEKYQSGEHDIDFKKLENGLSELVYGPSHTFECDYEALRVEQERINNGLRLFGKYYKGLWD
jgi:hypothetical protein